MKWGLFILLPGLRKATVIPTKSLPPCRRKPESRGGVTANGKGVVRQAVHSPLGYAVSPRGQGNRIRADPTVIPASRGRELTYRSTELLDLGTEFPLPLSRG